MKSRGLSQNEHFHTTSVRKKSSEYVLWLDDLISKLLSDQRVVTYYFMRQAEEKDLTRSMRMKQC